MLKADLTPKKANNINPDTAFHTCPILPISHLVIPDELERQGKIRRWRDWNPALLSGKK